MAEHIESDEFSSLNVSFPEGESSSSCRESSPTLSSSLTPVSVSEHSQGLSPPAPPSTPPLSPPPAQQKPPDPQPVSPLPFNPQQPPPPSDPQAAPTAKFLKAPTSKLKFKKTSEKSLNICHDYVNSICKRDACKFQHVSLQEEEYFKKTGKLPEKNNQSTLAPRPALNVRSTALKRPANDFSGPPPRKMFDVSQPPPLVTQDLNNRKSSAPLIDEIYKRCGFPITNGQTQGPEVKGIIDPGAPLNSYSLKDRDTYLTQEESYRINQRCKLLENSVNELKKEYKIKDDQYIRMKAAFDHLLMSMSRFQDDAMRIVLVPEMAVRVIEQQTPIQHSAPTIHLIQNSQPRDVTGTHYEIRQNGLVQSVQSLPSALEQPSYNNQFPYRPSNHHQQFVNQPSLNGLQTRPTQNTQMGLQNFTQVMHNHNLEKVFPSQHSYNNSLPQQQRTNADGYI